jgi:hypothetical protein
MKHWWPRRLRHRLWGWLEEFFVRAVTVWLEGHTGTVVVRLEQREEGADGEDPSVFGKHLHGFNTLKRCVK